MGVQYGLLDSEHTIFWPIDIAVGFDHQSGWICANCGEKYTEVQFGFEQPRYCPSCGLIVYVPDDEDGDAS